MEVKDYIMVIAVLLGPILAVQAEKFIERTRQSRNRKIQIFKTLMSSRGAKLSIDHVTALNQIEVEFYGKKYQRITYAWKEYFDQLCVSFDETNLEQVKNWDEKCQEYLATLLYEMGVLLGYDFNKVAIKRDAYSPKGYLKTDNENAQIRNLLIKVLNGENLIVTKQVTTDDLANLTIEAAHKTSELQTLLIDHYKNGKPINVKLTKE